MYVCVSEIVKVRVELKVEDEFSISFVISFLKNLVFSENSGSNFLRSHTIISLQVLARRSVGRTL